jgi:hypothetical protein
MWRAYIGERNTLCKFLARFRIYNIALPPQKNLGRKGASDRYTPSTFTSIFKKSRHLGFGVFKDILSMAYCALCIFGGLYNIGLWS